MKFCAVATTLAFQVSCSQSYIYQDNDRNCQKLLEIRNFTTYKKRTCQKRRRKRILRQNEMLLRVKLNIHMYASFKRQKLVG